MGYYDKYCNFEVLKGEMITGIIGMEENSGEIIFTTQSGSQYKMYHEQDCCENVWLADICGDVSDLINSVVLHAEERTCVGDSADDWGSSTFTFYDIQTNKGSVNLRWIGESNGYYSESVSFIKLI